jgi:hypothetical protein
MERSGGAPRAVAHARDLLAVHAGRLERNAPPVARHHVAVVREREPARAHLQALEARVDVAHGSAAARLLAEDVPRLDRVAELEVDARGRRAADAREAELEVRVEPGALEREARGAEIREHLAQIHVDEVRQQEPVVELRAPACRAEPVRLAPEPRDEPAQQELLHEAHPRVRRHLERAELEEPEAAGRGLGGVELVDAELGAVRVAGDVGQQVAEDAVDEPRRALAGAGVGNLLERELELVHAVVSRLVDARRLARRADEEPGEEVRERRVVEPVADEAPQQVGAAEDRAVRGRRAAEDDVVAAAGSRVPPVEHELLGAEARRARVLVERGHVRDELAPARGGLHVHLDHAGVGRDAELLEPRIEGRRVALDGDRHRECGGRRFDRGDEREIVLRRVERRHEDVEPPRARFDGERRPHDPGRGLAGGRNAIGIGGAPRGYALACRCAGRAGGVGRERSALRHRIFGLEPVRRRRIFPEEAREREPEADRRVAGHEDEPPGAHRPAAALPRGAVRTGDAAQRQDASDRRREPAVEDAAHALARVGVGELAVGGVDVQRKAAFLADEVPRIFVRRHRVLRVERERFGEGLGEALRVDGRVDAIVVGPRHERGVAPDRHAVAAPDARERPARERLARVPLARAEVEERAGRDPRAEPADQLLGEPPLPGAERRVVPLGAVAVVDRDERRLAADREAHVVLSERRVDPLAERVDARPARVVVRKRDAGILVDPLHAHREVELGARLADLAGHGRGGSGLGGRGERQVALAREEPGRRIEAHPSGAGQVRLRPRVEIGEVGRGARRTVERLLVGTELDQVARHEPGRDPEVAEDLHEEPRGVAARAGRASERLLGRLYAGREPDLVPDRLREAPVQLDEEVDGAARADVDSGEVRREAVAARRHLEERAELLREPGVVAEREALRGRLEEEVERVRDGELGDEVDADLEVAHGLREDRARQEVSVRVLLPVEEVIGRVEGQRVARDRRPAVRGRSEPHELRRERDHPVVPVSGEVREGDADHGAPAEIGPDAPRRTPSRVDRTADTSAFGSSLRLRPLPERGERHSASPRATSPRRSRRARSGPSRSRAARGRTGRGREAPCRGSGC